MTYQLTIDQKPTYLHAVVTGHNTRENFVDVHREGHLMKFAETVAINRALPLAVFATVAEAEQWLREGGGGEPHAAADADGPRP